MRFTVLGMCEIRRTNFGKTKLDACKSLLYSGKEDENNPHEVGVSLLFSKEASGSLLEWEPVSKHIIRARFQSRFHYHVLCPNKCSERGREAQVLPSDTGSGT